MKWPVLGIAAVLVLSGLAAGLFKLAEPNITERAFQRAINENVGRDRAAEMDDGLHVYICGAGSPMPDPFRAGPCLGIVAGKRVFMIDAGSGGSRNLARMGFPTGRVEAVYLTHLHSDHIDGLGDAMLQAWVGGGREVPLDVRGPTGTAMVVEGFNTVYRIDSGYRTVHHGRAIANPAGYGAIAGEFLLPAGPEGAKVVLDDSDLKITAFAVSHSPVEPAYGYRVDYRGRSIAVSGDTVYHPGLVMAAKGVDVLFHDAISPEMIVAMSEAARVRGAHNLSVILSDILDYHASPADAARAAQDAGAKQLVLYHIVPPLPSKRLDTMFRGEADKAYTGRITIARDGLIISLPTESQEIFHQRAF